MANSSMLALPMITAPARSRRFTAVAVKGGRYPSRIFDPQVVGKTSHVEHVLDDDRNAGERERSRLTPRDGRQSLPARGPSRRGVRGAHRESGRPRDDMGQMLPADLHARRLLRADTLPANGAGCCLDELRASSDHPRNPEQAVRSVWCSLHRELDGKPVMRLVVTKRCHRDGLASWVARRRCRGSGGPGRTPGSGPVDGRT